MGLNASGSLTSCTRLGESLTSSESQSCRLQSCRPAELWGSAIIHLGAPQMSTRCLQILLHFENEMHFDKHQLYNHSKLCLHFWGDTPHAT